MAVLVQVVRLAPPDEVSKIVTVTEMVYPCNQLGMDQDELPGLETVLSNEYVPASGQLVPPSEVKAEQISASEAIS